MATWYVRPNTSHNATRNGTSYATAWGGWSEIVWGGAGVVGNDTLYICGAHASSSTLTVGAHGATAGNLVTISGGYAPAPGSITFTGAVFLNFGRSYTTLASLTITAGTSNCLFISGAMVGQTIQQCTFTGGTGASIISISGGNGSSYTDFVIDDNDFIGGSGSTGGSAISWLVIASGTPVNSLNRMTINKNRFTGCSSSRSVVHLRIEDGANVSTKMADIRLTRNTFTDCIGVAAEIYGPSVYGRNTGIVILDNIMNNQQPTGILGGGFSISGFGPSLTSDFGSNVIARNKGYIVRGPTGLINIFYGTYRVFDNYGEDLSTHTIDGNGVLPDHGCADTVIHSNEFKRLTGKDGVPNSGCGIMILDATGITAYGNIFDGCRTGLYIGNKLTGQSSNIYNNSFLNCSSRGADILATANFTDNLARNNIFTAASGAAASVVVDSGTWAGESGNGFYGFGAASGHTLNAPVTDNPELDANYRPAAAAYKRTATYLGGKDFSGKQFYNPPNFGAVDEETTTPRFLLKIP